MSDRTLAGSIGLKGGWTPGENGWGTDMQDNLLWLSILVQGRIIDQVTAEPGSPSEGDVYLLAASHATHPNQLAAYDGGAWHYRAPAAGWRLFNTTLALFSQFSGTAWVNDTAGLTAADVHSIMASALTSGSNVSIVDDGTHFTINAIGDGTGLDAEGVRDVIGAALTSSGLATVTVNDAGDTINIGATGDGTGLTAEQVMDQVAAMLQAGSNVTLTYNDAADTLTIAAAGGGSTPTLYYNYGSFAVSSIAASEVLMDHIVTTAHTLGANFAGSQSSVGTNPAAAWTANVQKNGANIGTLAVSTGGVVTFATTGGATVAVAAGDVIAVVGPASADAAIARLRFTFRGTI